MEELNKIKSYFHHHLARPVYQMIRPFQPIFNLKKRTFFDKFKVKTKDGVEFWLYNNAFYWETEIFWQGFNKINWEMKTREIWSELARQSDVILDIGANTGIFSVIAQAYNPNSEIYAFEPQPNIFNVLKKNNEINSFDIQCLQIALSDTTGEFPFYNTGDTTFEGINTTHGSLNKNWRPKNQLSISVPVDRLDDFLERSCSKKVDLIKIDVETLEFEVLLGYAKLLYIHLPIIILEIQNENIGLNIFNLLKDECYQFFWINENKGLVPVETLGAMTNQENLNYLLCPSNKLNQIQKWL